MIKFILNAGRKKKKKVFSGFESSPGVSVPGTRSAVLNFLSSAAPGATKA